MSKGALGLLETHTHLEAPEGAQQSFPGETEGQVFKSALVWRGAESTEKSVSQVYCLLNGSGRWCLINVLKYLGR